MCPKIFFPSFYGPRLLFCQILRLAFFFINIAFKYTVWPFHQHRKYNIREKKSFWMLSADMLYWLVTYHHFFHVLCLLLNSTFCMRWLFVGFHHQQWKTNMLLTFLAGLFFLLNHVSGLSDLFTLLLQRGGVTWKVPFCVFLTIMFDLHDSFWPFGHFWLCALSFLTGQWFSYSYRLNLWYDIHMESLICLDIQLLMDAIELNIPLLFILHFETKWENGKIHPKSPPVFIMLSCFCVHPWRCLDLDTSAPVLPRTSVSLPCYHFTFHYEAFVPIIIWTKDDGALTDRLRPAESVRMHINADPG